MESLGDYLKREREFRKISLGEISRTTKIREEILKDLEDDRLDSSASPVFVKGFLRAYAAYVGLNPDDVVLRYEVSSREEKDQTLKKPAEETPRQWIYKYIVFPVSLLLVLGVLLFLLLHRPTTIETETEPRQMPVSVTRSVSQTESTARTAAREAGSVSPPHSDRQKIVVYPPPLHPPRPVAPPLSETPLGFELQLRAVQDTWFRIQIDQGSPVEILLKSGETISRRGEKNIEMMIGNAGGLEIFHNGKNLGRLGESGKVVHLSISPEGVKPRRTR